MSTVAFDIGGTSIRVANAKELRGGAVRKVPTPKDPKEGIQVVVALLRESAQDKLTEVAGGFPGTLCDGVIMRAANLPAWEGVRLSDELSRALRGLPVQIENDADCAALGEAIYGAGKNFNTMAYIGIGTGVGTGRIVSGRIDRGAYHFEAGRQIIDYKNLESLESLVSGRSFEKRFAMHPREVPRERYTEAASALAVGIYNIIAYWSPEVVILGGSMMNEENGYRLSEVTEALHRLSAVYPEYPDVRLAKHKDTAGLYGALAMVASGASLGS